MFWPTSGMIGELITLNVEDGAKFRATVKENKQKCYKTGAKIYSEAGQLKTSRENFLIKVCFYDQVIIVN